MAFEKVVLFDGTNLDKWYSRSGGGPAKWEIGDDGAMTVVPRTGDIISTETFGDAHIHVEFWLPLMADARGQDRANSGVYVQGCYEVQVLDSYGIKNYGDNDCGGIYGLYKPLANANLEPEKWQTYDIYIRAAKFDENGNVTEDAYITVLFNGVCIHNASKLYDATGGNLENRRVAVGPLMLQDHGNKVRYRNVWFERLDRDSDK